MSLPLQLMTEQPSRYHTMLKAIDAERKHDEAFFKNLNESKTMQQKVNAGFVWYPVQIIRKSYTIGEYLEVEVQRIKNTEKSHKFSEGMAASLFNIQDERQDFKVVISAVRGDKMRMLLHTDQSDRLDILEKGLSGVEVIYDDKPYKVMEAAIKAVIDAKKDNHRLLRDALTAGSLHQIDIRNTEENLYIEVNKNINSSQKNAIELCLSAPLMGIIHGPPGTGKTTTLVALAVALLKTEKRILVCASSNNAVDLLAERMSEKGLSVLRIGNITRIHDDLMHLTVEEKVRNHHEWSHIKKVKIQAHETEKKASQYKRNFGPEERDERRELRKEAMDLRKWAYELEDRLIDEIVRGSQVIATTLIGTSNKILKDMYFKTVIIDEASQSLEAECWNAMLKADRVILAGDHKQLPPTVKSTEAAKLGMETTILDILTDQNSHSSLLTEQYRMHHKILGFSNVRYYESKLDSHTDVVNRTLRNDHLPLVYIDTAGCGFEEVMNNEHRSYANLGEYFIIREHILSLSEKLLGTSIGIICPYSEQVRYIRQQISDDEILRAMEIEVNSIDGFQGQEKEVIYISLVRCNDTGDIGFLKDERRINVAMTRAQKKLVIVGDSATIGQHKLFLDLMAYIEKEGHYDSAWNYMGY
ncbi:MAG: AAA family ATPase [Saprospiraceae bacterium]|nr:AAA family ATPase [Saprospiraceae bacterium]